MLVDGVTALDHEPGGWAFLLDRAATRSDGFGGWVGHSGRVGASVGRVVGFGHGDSAPVYALAGGKEGLREKLL